MLSLPSTTARREKLRARLTEGPIVRAPGAFSPLVARLIEETQFDAVYVSGAVLSAQLALPDIGLTTQTEVVERSAEIARVTALPTIVDIDTGFGEPNNVYRSIQLLEDAGVAGCHLEDQVNPKRCGHLDGKELIAAAEMIQKIRAAVAARRDPNFLLIARTDARSVEGLDSAIDRANLYLSAGADSVFPEGLNSKEEFELFAKAVRAPLLANMTEFGKSPLLTAAELEEIGYRIVIYPVTALRLAMGCVEESLKQLYDAGTQAELLAAMQTRERLYELLRYDDYRSLDSRVTRKITKDTK